jgi:myo-inositol-1(or 4)-monophosphatase
MADDPFDGRTAFAHGLADAAGAVIVPFFRRRIEVTNKAGGDLYDPVTEADRGAERALRALIEKHYPDDAILGEEYGAKAGHSGFRWVLDPIDGTRAFIAGQPLWGTLISLEQDGVPVMGVLDQPFLRERFVGFQRTAELRNAEGVTPLNVRACAALAEAVISTTHPILHFKDEERAQYFRVEKAARLSRYGGDCYAYALIAMGFVDLVIETELKRWDVSALVPIVEGAGGIVTNWQGGKITDGGSIVAAGDVRVHAEALKILNAR